LSTNTTGGLVVDDSATSTAGGDAFIGTDRLEWQYPAAPPGPRRLLVRSRACERQAEHSMSYDNGGQHAFWRRPAWWISLGIGSSAVSRRSSNASMATPTSQLLAVQGAKPGNIVLHYESHGAKGIVVGRLAGTARSRAYHLGARGSYARRRDQPHERAELSFRFRQIQASKSESPRAADARWANQLRRCWPISMAELEAALFPFELSVSDTLDSPGFALRSRARSWSLFHIIHSGLLEWRSAGHVEADQLASRCRATI